MTCTRRKPGSHGEKGFSLIELMISLTIGLIIVAAAMSAYVGAAGAGRVAEAQARMNEDGQAALAILTQQLSMGGTNPVQTNRDTSSRRNPVYSYSNSTNFAITVSSGTLTLSQFVVRGCDGKFSDVTTATSLDTLTCAAGTTTLPDSIAVKYEADRYNTVPTNAGVPTDCLGNGMPIVTATLPTITGTSTTSTTNVTYTVADNRFYIGTSSYITSPSLYCKGNAAGTFAQPLVENIEDMQLTYGTVSATTTSTTATVAGYLDASEVVTQANLATLPIDQRWGKVKTVRICVIVRSENPVAATAESARYAKCDGSIETAPPDLRLRRAYSSTVVLRNWQQ